MTVLLTGFEAFGRVTTNPSELIVRHFAEQGAEGLVTDILPVRFEFAGERIEALIRQWRPDAILMLGVSASRNAINLERVAININDAKLADNAGQTRSGQHIVPDGPVGYWSTLPLDAMREALIEVEIPVRMSNHAGAYVCNHVFYVARHTLEQIKNPAMCGFIHVPNIGDEPPGLPIETMIKAIERCVGVVQSTLEKSKS